MTNLATKTFEPTKLATEICAHALGMTTEQVATEILNGNKAIENSVKMILFSLLTDNND